ncbi:TRAP transporter permease [Prosthecomicrobium hirschii]|uniref:TRAP transporter permease n=1 Tax=Prosthecodimorpha hirschii TaxID=665126 RepID=UPI0022207F8B|nr:TRAP transporter permease [Prosthecomicrobium hirschii]MCW1839791.1 TRAP transporter permease [Prosthecomicrobium hirschii]
MTDTPIAQDELARPSHADNPEIHLPEDFGPGLGGTILFWIGVAFSTFQIVTAFGIPLDKPFLPGLDAIRASGGFLILWAVWTGWRASRGAAVVGSVIGLVAMAATWILLARYAGGVPSQVLRALHVGFLCLLAGGMLANHRSGPGLGRILSWAIGIAAFAIGLYQWHLYEALVQRSGDLTPLDFVVGGGALAILVIMVWRAMGPALPIVALIFLAYSLFGHWLPRPLDHRPYDVEQVVEHMVFGTEGIYGTPTLVSATYIFLFILFGAFMEKAGVIDFFNDISMALFGGSRGGPAKVCVASSALMGTVSGSGVANVVASGQFTIPLMKRFGFTSAFAGGVEATSSMGGQIMPPVMGAVAFIMAETIDVPYSEIVKAAIIPACLYFAACFWSVHLEAGKLGLQGLPRAELPSFFGEIRRNWFLILPLAVLVWLLFAGFTPLFAGAVGVALTVIMIIGTALAFGLGSVVVRTLFWLALAGLSAASLWFSVAAVTAVVFAMVIPALLTGRGRETLLGCRAALADGARQALPVGLACALVGIVIGTMTLTGLGTIVGNSLISLGKENLAATLVLTMIFSLILGMGIPTIPNYIITSSLAAPILLGLNIPLIVSHMFVFYFGIMADLTPPVALAAFAAAPMAKESGMKIGMQAVRIALPGFIIPYMAIYDPTLMLQPVAGLDGALYWLAVGFTTLKAVIAMALWGIAAFGHLDRPVSWPERIYCFVAAGFLIFPSTATDIIGLVATTGFLAWRLLLARRRAAA